MSITIILCIAIIAVSLAAFNKPSLSDQLSFHPYTIWRSNEWYRIITHSFIHADSTHLIFNMIALFSFGTSLERYFDKEFPGYGTTLFIALFSLAVVVSSLYDLFTRKNDRYYVAVGASGGVSAIIFAAILLSPVGIFFYGFIPAFVFGPLYLVYTAYMAKRGQDNIGHNAHFYGSVFGFIFPLLFKPELLAAFFEQILNFRF